MNTIGAGNNVNTMGTHQQSVNCLGGNEEALSPKENYRSNSGIKAKDTGNELKAFASKIKAEYQETAEKIEEKTGEIGTRITGSKNQKMSCMVGALALALSTGPGSGGVAVFVGAVILAGLYNMATSPEPKTHLFNLGLL